MKNLILLFLFLNLSSSITAQVNPDSLWSVWSDETQPVVTRLEAISVIHLGRNQSLSFSSNNDSVLYHAQLQYDFAEANGLKYWMAHALTMKGCVFLRKNDHKKASEYYIESLALAEEIGNKKQIARNSFNLGLIPFKEGNFGSAFPHFERAAKLFEKLDEKILLALTLSNMSLLFAQQKELKQSNEYLKQAISIREEIAKTDNGFQNKFFLAGMKQNYKNQEAQIVLMDDITDSIGKAEAAEKIKLAKDTLLLLATENGKAFPLASKKEGNKKTNQIKQDKKEKSFFSTVGSLTAEAQIHLDQKDSVKAIPILEEAFKLAKKENELTSLAWISFTLHQSYKATRQYKKSLKMIELAIEIRDSIVNIDNAKAVIQQQVKSVYEKQKAIDDLENEKRVAIETQKKESHQKLSIAIGIGLLLISLLAVVIFNRLKVTRQQKAIIEEQKKSVEQSEKYKEQFLANMSHEIRTPMHAISGMVKILKRNEHLPIQDTFLNAMQTSSDNLVVILNDVLDLSKIEAGKLDIESIPMSIAAVIENVIQILKYKAEEKGLQLNYQINEYIPDLVMGDPTRLNQILINLAGNAIKFTEKGNVNILLQKENDRLRFSIKDTGIGIPKEKVESIFGAFEQAKDSTTRNYGGTGLGLSISKQLVELQQGKIWAESEEGQGSTFFVELPLVAAAANAVSENLITEDKLKTMAASLEGIRILLAEDNAFNQMIAQDDLSFFIKNVKIDVVENGVLAVEKFKSGNYDLILMDVQMPEMNGFEATQKIREIEKLAEGETRIPIIAMTASLLKTEIDSCRQAGMNNYIPKPYKAEELIAPIFAEMNLK